MKHKVVLNNKIKYLHVTTADIPHDDEDLIVLFSCSSDINGINTPSVSINNCNLFCLGYIRGNNEVKVKNSIKDFGF